MTGQRDAELAKLARTLGCSGSDVRFLAGVPAEDLRALRHQVDAALFDADRAAFEKVAALARVVPAVLAAKIAEVALQPRIAARIAEALDPGKAVELIGRISDSYLADVAAALDPNRAARAVASIPAERVETVARELARRGDWMVIGGFISALSPTGLRGLTAALDGAQLLRCSYFVDDAARLTELTAALTDAQLDELLQAASASALWPQLDALVSASDRRGAARLAARLAAAPAGARARVDRAAAAGELSAVTRARLLGK